MQSTEHTGPIPPAASCCHLPLQCITNSAREKKINSSLQLPDRVLNFLKDHFLMDGKVRSQLLLLQPEARYQRVAIHHVSGLNRTYDVLFLGTSECQLRGGMGKAGRSQAVATALGLMLVLGAGDGRLHKAVRVGAQVHVIEELQVFEPGQPVQTLLLDKHGVSCSGSLMFP